MRVLESPRSDQDLDPPREGPEKQEVSGCSGAGSPLIWQRPFGSQIWGFRKGLWEDRVASKAGGRGWAEWGSRSGKGWLAPLGAAEWSEKSP